MLYTLGLAFRAIWVQLKLADYGDAGLHFLALGLLASLATVASLFSNVAWGLLLVGVSLTLMGALGMAVDIGNNGLIVLLAAVLLALVQGIIGAARRLQRWRRRRTPGPAA